MVGLQELESESTEIDRSGDIARTVVECGCGRWILAAELAINRLAAYATSPSNYTFYFCC